MAHIENIDEAKVRKLMDKIIEAHTSNEVPRCVQMIGGQICGMRKESSIHMVDAKNTEIRMGSHAFETLLKDR